MNLLMRRRFPTLATLAGILMCLCAGPLAAADMSKTLRVAFPVDVTGFDPQVTQDLYSSYIERSLFDPLLTYDHLVRPYQLAPNTAAALPEIKDGGRTIIVRLRRGVYFTPDQVFKGRKRELTADDYVFSWKRIIDPAVTSPNLFIFENKLVGADELITDAKKTGKFDYDAKLEGLQALDRYTLQIKLKNPDYGLVDYMTTTQLSAVAREVIAAYGAKGSTWAHDHPVGTGPYYMKEWKRGSKLVLEANQDFRDISFPERGEPADAALIKTYMGRKLPLVGRIDVSIIEESNPRLLAFKSKEIDYLYIPTDLVNQVIENGKLKDEYVKAGIQWSRELEPSLQYTYFNMEDPFVGGYTPDKIALRRAIVMGYNGDEEIRVIRNGQGVPASQPVPPGLAGHDPKLKPANRYNPAAARALLDKFGYKDKNGDGYREMPDDRPLVIRMGSTPDSTHRLLDELWTKNMDAIGIKLEFVKQKWPDLLKMSMAGHLMMWNIGWQSGVRDGDSFLGLLYSKNKGNLNDARFSLPEFDRLYEASKQLPDSSERTALYRKMSEIVQVYAPWHPGYYSYRNALVQPWVKGFKQHAFIDHPWMYLDVVR
jgi:oligopeptide transport system substrate-binding protein